MIRNIQQSFASIEKQQSHQQESAQSIRRRVLLPFILKNEMQRKVRQCKLAIQERCVADRRLARPET